MTSWGLVATVKAPEDRVLAFVAHHLALGAAHLWLYFDDPDDPAFPALVGHPQITATRCDAAYWTGKTRHDRHQNRQARNARDAYERCHLDWLGHIDVDEFIHPDRPLTDILAAVPSNQLLIKLEPFEAMHDPILADDIYTAIAFRGALRHDTWRLRRGALGKYRTVIRDGMLSHSVGKVLVRSGIPGISPRLHGVMLKGARLPAPEWCSEARLLHFHAQDRQAWLQALPFRLTRGAYQYRPELQAFLQAADADEIARFYERTQIIRTDLIDSLRQSGRLVLADLQLRQKVQDLQGRR